MLYFLPGHNRRAVLIEPFTIPDGVVNKTLRPRCWPAGKNFKGKGDGDSGGGPRKNKNRQG